MGRWIGWGVVSWVLLFVQGMVQTWKEVANVLFDELCNFLTVLNVYLSWTACLVLMLSKAHLLVAVQLPCCRRVYALRFTSWDSTISTHLNPTSHSKYILARSRLLYSCCLHFQLGTTNHLSWSEFIPGHQLERALLSLLYNPHYEHWSLPCSFLFSLSTTFDTANELWTACKRGWLFWNILF